MNLLGIIAAFVSVFLLTMAIFRDLGYRSGVKDGHAAGYEEGRKAAEEWLLRFETQVEQARQEIWRAEASSDGRE